MRRYMIASWILFILSIINFTLAAPVAVRDINGVRINTEDVAKDSMAEMQKRMDPDEPDEDQRSDLTSEHGEPGPGPGPDPDSDPGPESEGDNEYDDDDNDNDDDNDDDDDDDDDDEEEQEGYEPDPEPHSDSNSDSNSNSDSDSHDSDGGDAAAQWEEVFQNYQQEDIGDNQDNQQEEDHEHVEQGPPDSPDHDDDFLQRPESQHPATFINEDLWSKLLEGSLKPRTSISGLVDSSKKDLQKTGEDTTAYVSTSIPLLVSTSNLPKSLLF
jgi:hypothetical protein